MNDKQFLRLLDQLNLNTKKREVIIALFNRDEAIKIQERAQIKEAVEQFERQKTLALASHNSQTQAELDREDKEALKELSKAIQNRYQKLIEVSKQTTESATMDETNPAYTETATTEAQTAAVDSAAFTQAQEARITQAIKSLEKDNFKIERTVDEKTGKTTQVAVEKDYGDGKGKFKTQYNETENHHIIEELPKEEKDIHETLRAAIMLSNLYSFNKEYNEVTANNHTLQLPDHIEAAQADIHFNQFASILKEKISASQKHQNISIIKHGPNTRTFECNGKYRMEDIFPFMEIEKQRTAALGQATGIDPTESMRAPRLGFLRGQS